MVALLRHSRFAFLLYVFAFSLSTRHVRAQDGVLVHIVTNHPEAIAYADTVLLGSARLAPYRVHASTREIRLVAAGERTWSVLPVEVSLDAAPGDTVSVHLDFPFYHRIETHPFGADAWLQRGGLRTRLGTTPFVHVQQAALSGVFVLELEGYASRTVEPRNELWNRYEIRLTPLDLATGDSQPLRSIRRRWWIDATAAALAVTAGAVTVHYKFKADRLNDRYQETGDPTLRPRVATLDDRAGIALGVMQVGLGTLAIRFILR